MAAESSEQRGKNANRYRLSVRLREVELLIRYTAQQSKAAITMLVDAGTAVWKQETIQARGITSSSVFMLA